MSKESNLNYGPNTVQVQEVLDNLKNFTEEQWTVMGEAYDAACDAAYSEARDAACEAAWDEARDGALDAAWDEAYSAAYGGAYCPAWDAVLAEVVKDLITQEQYELLTGPYKKALVVGL